MNLQQMTPVDLDDVLQRIRRPWLRWLLRRPVRPLLRLQVRRWARGLSGRLDDDLARRRWAKAMTSPDVERRPTAAALMAARARPRRLTVVHTPSDVDATRRALAALLEENPDAHTPIRVAGRG